MLAVMNAQSVFAQQSITAATLSGVVEDVNGAIIGGTIVTATNLETNQKQSSNSDANGRFRFPYLTAGNYEIKAEKSGFASSVKRIVVTIGQATEFIMNAFRYGRLPMRYNATALSISWHYCNEHRRAHRFFQTDSPPRLRV